MRRELPEPWTIGVDFYRFAQDINLPYKHHAPTFVGYKPEIIRSIKSLRKKN